MTGGDGTTSNFPSTAALQHQSVDNDGGWGGGWKRCSTVRGRGRLGTRGTVKKL